MVGWTANADMFKELIKTLNKQGRRVIVVNNFFGINHSYSEKCPDIVLRNAAAAIATLKAKKLKRVDGIGHSSGCLSLSVAAKMHPSYFRSIVLVTPAGFLENDSLLKLATRFSHDQILQRKRSKNIPKVKAAIAQTMKTSLQAFKQSLIHPVSEAKAIVNLKIRQIIKAARKSGVKIGILHTESDKAFPVQRVIKSIGKDLVDILMIVPGTHNELYLFQKKQALIVDKLLDKLSKKK
jgi:pimeloyl-ACP methyl ester carboxylesterase